MREKITENAEKFCRVLTLQPTLYWTLTWSQQNSFRQFPWQVQTSSNQETILK